MDILLLIMTIIIFVMLFVIVNLLNKNEKLEEHLENSNTYIESISLLIDKTSSTLKEMDSKGYYKSDDEVGFFFKYIENVQEIINKYNVLK